MSMNSVASSIKAPIFVKQMTGAGGVANSYANINDIANLRQIKDNYWEAESINGTNVYGGKAIYHFDNQGASQIINYIA